MTDNELIEWTSFLGEPGKKKSEIILDLLKNAKGDGMSAQDVKDCKRALTLIQEGKIHDYNPIIFSRRPLDSRLLPPERPDGDPEIEEL